MDAIRVVISEMRAAENRQLILRTRQSERSDQHANALLAVLVLLVFLALLASYLSLRHQLQLRKRASREIERLNTELSAKNSQLESFTAAVSHELLGPVHRVRGFADLLEHQYESKLDDNGLRLVGRIKAGAVRMEELIDDLLEFCRAGQHELRLVLLDTESIVRGVCNDLRPGYPKVELDLGVLAPAYGDPSLIRQVWRNLMANAFKYSSKAESPKVEVGAVPKGNQVEYWIRDNGAGFDMAHADRLFGVFQRLHTDREFPGTGIGLAIVQSIVQRHGGDVRAEGEPGKGATFYFTLPNSKMP